MKKHKNSYGRIVVIITVMFIMTFIQLLSGLSGPTGEVKAGPDLPPRPTPTPIPDNNNDDDDDDGGSSTPLTAYIQVQASSAPAGAWNVVQWQAASNGKWYDVEGWRSLLGTGGYQQWTVLAKDFDTGPFRWQVRVGGPDGSVWGTSDTFNLPAGANQTLRVTVSETP